MAVAPLLAGLYAGDVDRLSASATFPELVAWEATQGSLIRGSQAAMRSARRGTPTPMFVKPKGGVERLTDTLAASLGDRVVTGAPVGSLGGACAEGGDVAADRAGGAGVRGGSPAGTATPPAAADGLRAIPYASTGVVFLVFGEGTQASLPEGTGFVVPRGKAPMTACTWISSKWPDPAYGSRAVVRCYVGGVGDEDVLEASDDELVDACVRHLAAVLDLPERPESSSVVRWMRAMPQYEVGHVDRVAAIRRSLPAGIFVVGSAYDGVGHPRLRPRGRRDGRAGPGAPRPRDDRKGDGSMSDTDDRHRRAIYALYPAFRARDGFRDLSADGLADVVQEVENLYKSFDGRVEVRGTYSTVGFRHDTDLLLWLVGPLPTTCRRSSPSSAARRRDGSPTSRGRSWAWSSRRSSPPITGPRSSRACRRRRSSACIRSCARRSGTCCRARSAARCWPSTAIVGREFPDVLANTTSAFGLGDWEWILAFEADRADMLVDCIRRLRDAKARLYTKEEIPFVTGIRKSVADALADLA